MSEKTIRTGSGADHRRSSTDWSRVSALSEAEIDDAIAADPDAYPLESEVLGRTSSSYHYKLFKDSAGKYRWTMAANSLGDAARETRVRNSRAPNRAWA